MENIEIEETKEFIKERDESRVKKISKIIQIHEEQIDFVPPPEYWMDQTVIYPVNRYIHKSGFISIVSSYHQVYNDQEN